MERLKRMWKALATLVTLGAVIGSGSKGKPKVKPGKTPAGKQAVLGTLDRLGVTDPVWRAWAVWVAYGESRWQSSAWLGRPGDKRKMALNEAAASKQAYERLVKQGRWKCPQVKSRYAIGSGGWFGQLAPFTALFAHELGIAAACSPTEIWLNAEASTRAHFRQVQGTYGILKSKGVANPTLLQLRAAYGLPSRDPDTMDTPARRAKYVKWMKAAGLDPKLLDHRVSGPLVLT